MDPILSAAKSREGFPHFHIMEAAHLLNVSYSLEDQMKHFGLFLIGLLPFAAPAAFGQITTAVVGAQVQTTNGRVSGSASFTAPHLIPPGVTGAPYSAEQVQEHIQILSDGTKITQPGMRIKLYRDSLGRARTERPLRGRLPDGQESPLIIQITDPIAGAQYVLDQQNKIAHRTTTQPVGSVPRQAPASPSQATFMSGVFTMSANGGVTQSPPARNGVRQEFTEEKLGPQMIEGVLAEGVRRVTTIPTGAQGNDRPFSITSETWRSSDLMIVVLSKTSDPRSGDSIMRLTNINRSEPDPSLFQPPADYQIVDETGQFTIHFNQ
jgi:hypothetical protein